MMKNKKINLGLKLLSLGLWVGSQAFPVAINFGGNFRTEGNYYTNLSQGFNGDSKKQFIRGRFLVDPNILVDDHFSIRSQWSLLESPNITPSMTAFGT